MTHDFSPVERFVDRIVASGGVNGAGIAIAVKGKPVFDYFAGEAAPGTPASDDTLWPLASISKSYTAAAIMSLLQEGRLGMWWQPSSLLTDFTGDGREQIDLRNLLTHTSGLSMGPVNGDELDQTEASLEERLAHTKTDPLLFPPGTGQSYSDSGYALAGLMAAKAAETTYPELIRTRVLEPAGLVDTFLVLPQELRSRVAQIAGRGGSPAGLESYSSPYGTQLGHPAYSAMATLSDLLRFFLQFDPLAESHVLSKAAIRTMSTNQTAGYTNSSRDFPIAKWGAGFQLQTGWGDTGFGPADSFGHSGGTGCIGWVAPSDAVTVAFVSNAHWSGSPEGRRWREEAVNVAIAAVTASVKSERHVGFRG